MRGTRADLVSHRGRKRAPEVCAGGQLTREQVLERSTEAAELIDLTIPDTESLTEALSTAVQVDHPVYDLLHAVTAKRHGRGVLTRDRRLQRLLDAMSVTVTR